MMLTSIYIQVYLLADFFIISKKGGWMNYFIAEDILVGLTVEGPVQHNISHNTIFISNHTLHITWHPSSMYHISPFVPISIISIISIISPIAQTLPNSPSSALSNI